MVSAYGGITNLLLENKKTAEPGIYASFAAGDRTWENKLEETRNEMNPADRARSKNSGSIRQRRTTSSTSAWTASRTACVT